MCDNIHHKDFLLFRLLEIENSYYQMHYWSTGHGVAMDAINIVPRTPGGAMSTKWRRRELPGLSYLLFIDFGYSSNFALV